jgi:hypothetical protein
MEHAEEADVGSVSVIASNFEQGCAAGVKQQAVDQLLVLPLCHSSETALDPATWDLAAPQGFEPRYADPESAVLPLNEGAV